MSSPFSVVSLFSGCGGSSLGYKMAGGRVLLAVEYDKNAVETYRLNHKDTDVYAGDIAALSVDECLERIGMKPGELDILDGSPPCQGFSTAGKRNIDDERNDLFREYVRLLVGLQPRVFVMENVSGMVKGKMKIVFAEIMQALKAAGYRVKARLLNAMYFGVPQARQRLIFIGVREDLDIEPTHPKPQTIPKTVREAIGHLPVGAAGYHQPQIIKAWHNSKPGQSLRKADRFVGSFQSARLDPDKPSSTQIRAHLNWHYLIPRHLTIQEAGIIQSFPEDYGWIGGTGEACARIGNSVPPLMMKAIAEHVRDNILDKAA
jgi:DNA (cytosine-5)-methyltransferase 1